MKLITLRPLANYILSKLIRPCSFRILRQCFPATRMGETPGTPPRMTLPTGPPSALKKRSLAIRTCGRRRV